MSSDYESVLLETWQRKPDAIPVLLSDNLWKEREIAALREQLATTASDGEQTCSACEQLGQAPSPDHLASVARYSAGVAQLVETQLLRERIIELAEANDALERERDAMQARAERAQAMVRQCADWFGVPLQEYVTRWGVDWMTATNDQMAADIRAALAERGEG